MGIADEPMEQAIGTGDHHRVLGDCEATGEHNNQVGTPILDQTAGIKDNLLTVLDGELLPETTDWLIAAGNQIRISAEWFPWESSKQHLELVGSQPWPRLDGTVGHYEAALNG